MVASASSPMRPRAMLELEYQFEAYANWYSVLRACGRRAAGGWSIRLGAKRSGSSAMHRSYGPRRPALMGVIVR